MSKKKIIIICVSALLIVFTVWMIWGNVALTVSKYTVESEKIPEAFSGFRIAQISDLHNDELGEGNLRLISKLEMIDPDIIVITGDVIDRSRTNVDVAIQFARSACRVATTYYVNGNHESVLPSGEYADFCKKMTDVGVIVLDDSATLISRDGEQINLVGLTDPSFERIPSTIDLAALRGDKSVFSIMLSHRPEDFEQYAECGYDLVLSGHLHGGQFRLPFLGGLYAPSYGLFPEYDGGRYESGESVMIVSRGVGNSSFPIRSNNPRDIVVIELKTK
jgi:predicted MPP superfamily phosphohydrolase